MFPNTIFGFIHLHGLLIGIGWIAAFAVLFLYDKKQGVNDKFTTFIFYNGIASIVIGFLAAMLFQTIYNYIKNTSAGFHFGRVITFIGGFIGDVICFMTIYFTFRKSRETKLSAVISILPCSIMVAHGFGRIGCFSPDAVTDKKQTVF